MNANEIILISQEDRRSYLLNVNAVLNTEELDTTIYHVTTWGALQNDHGEDAENLLSPALDPTTLGSETTLYYAGYMAYSDAYYTTTYIDPREAARGFLLHDAPNDIALVGETEARDYLSEHPDDVAGVANWL